MPPPPILRAPNRREFLSDLAIAAGAGALALRGQLHAAEPAVRVFQPSAEILPNPERGFYAQRRSDRMDRLEPLRAQGISLVLVTFDLREFRDRDLADEKLAELRQALNVARQQGFKVLFRAAYGFTGRDYRVDPIDLDLIVRHIRQISRALTEHGDVVSGIQAGMLGPWGEWHGSNHGNPPSPASRRAVLFTWLESVPAPIAVHIRRPMFIRDIFATESGGAELTDASAFSGSKLSRTGWHNDSFLVRPSDAGTYVERGWDRARELSWCDRHGRYTPFGGETVHTDTPMPVAEMIREMELLHATYLNIGYHPRVLQLWRESTHAGENAFEHIARRLGYRFVAERLDYPRIVRAGGSAAWELTLQNTGFASPHLPRVISVGLLPAADSAGRPPLAIVLPQADPRRWGPEAGRIRLRGDLPIPANLPRGTYHLGVRLADPSENLRDDGRYAIRFANRDIAFTTTGWNILADDIRVES